MLFALAGKLGLAADFNIRTVANAPRAPYAILHSSHIDAAGALRAVVVKVRRESVTVSPSARSLGLAYAQSTRGGFFGRLGGATFSGGVGFGSPWVGAGCHP